MDEIVKAKDRVVSAALMVVKAERGGFDHANADDEMELAHDNLDRELESYGRAAGWLG